jgi:hypothetical protein
MNLIGVMELSVAVQWLLEPKLCWETLPQNQRKTASVCVWTSCAILKISQSFFKWVVTGDESWGFEYDPNTIHHREECTLVMPCPKKARKCKSKTKLKFIYFCDHWGVLQKDFVSHSQTVNQIFYWGVLERFKDTILRQQHL